MNQSPRSEPEKPSAIDAGSSGPASAESSDYTFGLPPLPPKWSEKREPLKLNATDSYAISSRQELDDTITQVAAGYCEQHVMKTSILGGEPVTVSRCMACGKVDWEDLRRQVDAYARKYAARLLEETYGFFEYPDGSRRILWSEGKPQMVNIQQVYNLFTIDPGTNTCAPEPGHSPYECPDGIVGCLVDHSVTERPK